MTTSHKPLSVLLADIEAVWCYEQTRFNQLKQALDGMDYSLALQTPVRAAQNGTQPKACMWDDEDDSDTPSKPYRVENGIALLNLSGPMTKQFSWLSYYYGGTSTQQLGNLIRLAVADPDVTALLSIIYSPGGQVAGTADLAALWAWAGTQKPCLSFIEDLGCSAAYWYASQASDGVYLNNTSGTGGSVGTIMGVDDTSKANEMAGVKTYVFASGDRKGIGRDGTPLTEPQQAYLQAYIESVNVAFLSAVQTTRKLTDAQLKDVQRAGLYVGQEAVKIGLVDGIATLDECKAKLQQKVKQRQNTLRTSGAALSLPEPGASTSEPLLSTKAAQTVLEPSAASAASAAPRELAPAATTNPPAASSPAWSLLRAGGEGKPMKEKLVRILSALGLTKMAVAIVSSTDESPEALAQAMSEQVKAEVAERVQNHPLMLACEAAGIATPEALGNVLEMRAIGLKYVDDLRADARSQAIRAYGAEAGERIGATVNKLSVHEVKAMRDGWMAEADSKFGHGADGSAPARSTAPSAVALNAEETKEPANVSAWEKLSAEQQDTATKLGHAKTPEACEKFAAQYLKDAAK